MNPAGLEQETVVPRASGQNAFPGLIIREREPENLEFPFFALESAVTPNEQFFIRSHFAVPKIELATWRLKVEGQLERPLELTYEQLTRMPARTVTMVMECAGNSRIFLSPKVGGLQWELGAVGNAQWTGVPLADVLHQAGLKPNAVEVVRSIPDDREILFLPDMFLGAHVERESGRKMHVWMGECHVHAGIDPRKLQERAAAEPDAELLVHPECGCTTRMLWLLSEGVLSTDRTKVLSTGGMVHEASTSPARRFLVATETGILHQLRKGAPDKEFEPVDEYAVCRFMKAITPEKLLTSLREGVHEITVPDDVAERARGAVERMIAIGPTAGSLQAR